MEQKKGKMNINVKVTNNETGQVLFDGNGANFIGTLYEDEGRQMGVVTGSFNTVTIFESLMALKSVEKKLLKEHPQVAKLLLFATLSDFEKTVERTELDLTSFLKTE